MIVGRLALLRNEWRIEIILSEMLGNLTRWKIGVEIYIWAKCTLEYGSLGRDELRECAQTG